MILTRGILAFLPSSSEKGACSSIKEDRTRTRAILLSHEASLLSSSPSTGLSLTEQQATWSPAGSKAKKTDSRSKRKKKERDIEDGELPLGGRLVKIRGGKRSGRKRLAQQADVPSSDVRRLLPAVFLSRLKTVNDDTARFLARTSAADVLARARRKRRVRGLSPRDWSCVLNEPSPPPPPATHSHRGIPHGLLAAPSPFPAAPSGFSLGPRKLPPPTPLSLSLSSFPFPVYIRPCFRLYLFAPVKCVTYLPPLSSAPPTDCPVFSSSFLPLTVFVDVNRCTRMIRWLHGFGYRATLNFNRFHDWISASESARSFKDYVSRRESSWRTLLCQIFWAVTSWNILWRGNSMKYHSAPFSRAH